MTQAAERARGPRPETSLVGADYFATVGILLLQGRAFEARDEDKAAPVAVVSAAIAAR